MLRYTLVFLIALVNGVAAYGQIQVKGRVIEKRGKSAMPGVSVHEKGTQHGTTTDTNGNFSLWVQDKSAVLVVAFIGYITEEVPLEGRDSVKVKLIADCYRHWWDGQRVGFSAISGVINTPIGGQLDFTPFYFFRGTLKGSVSYQTNFNGNQLLNTQLGLYHLAASCYFDADAAVYFRSLTLNKKIKAKSYAVDANLNFNRVRFIVGYSIVDFTKVENLRNQLRSGPVLGAGTFIGRPLRCFLSGKVSVFKDLAEYQGEVSKQMKRINTFVRFYKLNAFTEVSLGVGTDFSYRLKKRKP